MTNETSTTTTYFKTELAMAIDHLVAARKHLAEANLEAETEVEATESDDFWYMVDDVITAINDGYHVVEVY